MGVHVAPLQPRPLGRLSPCNAACHPAPCRVVLSPPVAVLALAQVDPEVETFSACGYEDSQESEGGSEGEEDTWATPTPVVTSGKAGHGLHVRGGWGGGIDGLMDGLGLAGVGCMYVGWGGGIDVVGCGWGGLG